MPTGRPEPQQNGRPAMTTDAPRRRRDPAATAIAGAVAGSLVASLVVVGLAGLLSDSAALYGAACGAFSTVAVMAFGAYVVHVVAKVMPSASLLLALMTYALQLVALTAFMSVVTGSGALGETLSGGWLVAGVSSAVLAWVIAQIWFSARARVLAYDLAAEQPADTTSRGQEAGQ